MSKKIKKRVPKLRFSEFEGDWNELPISGIGEVIRGASPRPKGDRRYYGGKIPRLMVEDVTRDGKYVTPRTDFLTEEGAKLSRPCEKGTLTIVCSGTVGIPSFLTIDACIHDGFLAVRNLNKKIVNEDFLYHQLTTLRNVFESSATHGGVFTNLTTEVLKNFKIELTSIAEQEKIASFLGAIDTRLTQLRRKRDRLQTYKRGVMQEIFSQQIRFRGAIGSDFPDWEKILVKDIATNVSSGRSKANKDFGAYPVYGSTGIIGKSETGDYSGEAILIARVGANAGKIYFVSGIYGVTDNTIIVNVKSLHNIHLLRMQLEIKGLNSMVFGSGQPLITGTQVKKLQLICPSSFEEQEKIVNFLTAIDRKIETLSRQIDQTEQFKKGLLQKMFV